MDCRPGKDDEKGERHDFLAERERKEALDRWGAHIAQVIRHYQGRRPTDLPEHAKSVSYTSYEEELAERFLREEIGTDAYVAMLDAPAADDTLVSASLTGCGGTVRADVRLEGARRDRIRETLITGDFFVTPPGVVFDLEAALRGLAVADVGPAIETFFARTPADFLSLSPGDLRQGSRDGIEPAQCDCGYRLSRSAATLRNYGSKTIQCLHADINGRKYHDHTSRDGCRRCACFRRFKTVVAHGIRGGKTAPAARSAGRCV